MDISRRGLLTTGSLLGAQLASGALVPARAAQSGTEASGRAAIDAEISALLERYRVPAVGVAASLRGNPVLAAGYGHASLPFQVRADAETLFHTGSVGKHVTAAGVLKLVDAGKVDLSAPVGRYVTDIPAEWGRRPVRTLLQHTSGLPDYEEGFDWDRPSERAKFLKLTSALEPHFQPGASWSYSNTNYVVLGFLIETLSGRSYADYINAEILKPAGLRDSRVDAAEEAIARRAEPYIVTGEAVRHAVRMSSSVSGMADGGILKSARDIHAWDRSLVAGPTLSEAGRAAMWRPVRFSSGRTFPYGFGWNVDSLGPGRPYHSHGGAVPGFRTFYLRAPALNLGVMVMSNAEAGFSPVARHIAQLVAERFAPGSTPLSLKPIKDNDPALTRTARALFYRDGKPLNTKLFAPEMTVLINGKVGQNAFPDLTRMGQPDTFQLVQEDLRKTERFRRYRVTHHGRNDHLSVAYTPDGLVYAYWSS